MRVRVCLSTARLRRWISFSVSAGVHGSILAWVAFGPRLLPERAQSLYDQQIRPNESRIVWYNLRDRLPDIAPAPAATDARPPRARTPFDQTIVAGQEDDHRPPQMIWMPAPEIAAPKPLPLPNVVALAPAKLLRPFTAPAEERRASAAPELPEAPRAAAAVETKALPFEAPIPRPEPRAFTAPVLPQKRARPAAQLPESPTMAAAGGMIKLTLAAPMPRPEPRAFTAPATLEKRVQPALQIPEGPRVANATGGIVTLPLAAPIPRPEPRTFTAPATPERRVQPALQIPEGPPVAGGVEAQSLPFSTPIPRPQRAFTPPASPAKPAQPAPQIPEGPAVTAAAETQSLPLSTPLPRPQRAFTPPPSPNRPPMPSPGLAAAPPHGASGAPGLSEASLAIAGLNPANIIDLPTPPGSRQAGFSAGPQPRPAGGEIDGPEATLVVPGLLARGGTRDDQPTLVARLAPSLRQNPPGAARAVPGPLPVPSDARSGPALSPPDPRFEGRLIYTVAIQMPNISSYSGSWIVWFAEREPLPGAAPPRMRPPMPLRKVDPKYIPAAADERVEGTVRLSAVIRKNGRVEDVMLLRRLDDRLDQSAREALVKWEFDPALRNGIAVDVDAVFEIPFRLAPRFAK